MFEVFASLNDSPRVGGASPAEVVPPVDRKRRCPVATRPRGAFDRPASSTYRALTALSVLLLLLLSATRHAEAVITLGLGELGRTAEYGYGSRGLYLGNSIGDPIVGNWTHMSHPLTNWRFVDMSLYIDEITGDAVISGTMERYAGINGPEPWLVATLSLTDLEFRNPDGTYRDDSGGSYLGGSGGGSYNGGISLTDIQNVAAGIDPFTLQDASGVDGWGFEWVAATMELNNPNGYASTVPLTGWTGLNMPAMNHFNVAELHYDLEFDMLFDAWYVNEEEKALGGFFNVGDTKAPVSLPDDGGGTGTATGSGGAVPEPATYALALLAAGALFLQQLRRRVVERA
ncbi:MAG: PEP-CTERM sorting domain-containing protein [Planctomycetota bacterium]|nr:MAG: PEP-CTERM sorting domain-containing protein [Planctomycetota bacterium]REJ90068.1 MAG: PEP-CTERM sorting domain-containing protein [Planctomycetota bacterium]REK23148.1 MAG: PEP-CTERM sorting domain-containing protein [Planctomycetota bacterium]REK43423.1 MAG: PEP-CTERM sorting domain-containing protein [Planctomycetota bacterium]